MLRIHFGADDLTRIRVLDAPDPLWETLLSLHLLQEQEATPTFRLWRPRVRGQLNSSVGLLAALAPPRGYSADFLTPPVGVADLNTAVDTLLSTPRAALRADLTLLAVQPNWFSSLAAGSREVLHQLGIAVRHYFSIALEPFWNGIRHQVSRDRHTRSQTLLSMGVEGMLAGLHPTVRWHPPVLEVDYPVDQNLHLDGRGLVLAPSLFCRERPVTLHDPSRPPVLVYPIAQPGWCPLPDDTAADSLSLAALLGRTRAAVLEAIGASQHTSIVRDAGLVTTERHNGTARHTITRRGMALLEPDMETHA